MLDLVSGRAYRAYTHRADNLVGNLLICDEKLVIFSNNLIFVMNRNKSQRQFFNSLTEYQSMHSEAVAGYSDLYYDENFTLSTLLIKLADNTDSYQPVEMLDVIIKLKNLFDLH